MSATVRQLHPQPSEAGLFIRIGHTSHRILQTLHASRRLPIKRAVIQAAHTGNQKDLIDEFRGSGVELVLDTQSAELATPGGYDGSARGLPWAKPNRPHERSDFDRNYLAGFVDCIAEFAVNNKFDVVLAPTRHLEDARDRWRTIDKRMCEMLRGALDASGGKSIAIDYPLLTTGRAIRDEASRGAFEASLEGVPFDALWLRVSGFGMGATAAGARSYINAARDFHSLGRPIVADGIGGLGGLGTVAFGAVSGIAHGVAVKERFDVSIWRKIRSSGGGDTPIRIYVPGIDMYLGADQAKIVFSTRGATSLLACNDSACCRDGVRDKVNAPEPHFLKQRDRQLAELDKVPENRRADHYLHRLLGAAGMTARKAERLEFSDAKLAGKIRERRRRLDELHEVLDNLHQTFGDASRSNALRIGSARDVSFAADRWCA